MRGRGDRRGGRFAQGGPSLASRAREIFAGQADAVWLEAANTTSSAGSITGWADSLDPTHIMLPGGTAPLTPAASARFKGNPAIVFNSTGRVQSNRAAARFKKLHDNTGCSVFCVYAPTGLSSNSGIWSTYSSGAVPGTFHYQLATATHQVGTFKTGGLAANTGAVGSLAVGTAVVTEYHCRASDTPDIAYFQNGSSVYTGDFSSAADAGDPLNSLVIGALTALGTDGAFTEMCAFYFLPRVMTAAERLTFRSYLTRFV